LDDLSWLAAESGLAVKWLAWTLDVYFYRNADSSLHRWTAAPADNRLNRFPRFCNVEEGSFCQNKFAFPGGAQPVVLAVMLDDDLAGSVKEFAAAQHLYIARRNSLRRATVRATRAISTFLRVRNHRLPDLFLDAPAIHRLRAIVSCRRRERPAELERRRRCNFKRIRAIRASEPSEPFFTASAINNENELHLQ
jgi:hypothetical protein